MTSSAYPVTTGAAAPDYSLQQEEAVAEEPQVRHAADARVIPFDSLTTQAERESIRARAAELARPAPLKTETIQVQHARPAQSRSGYQRKLEYQGQAEVLTMPRTHTICDAPVAPLRLRLEAALIDAGIVSIPCLISLGVFLYLGGSIFEKRTLPFLFMALGTVPLLYKLLWAFAGCDTVGMRKAGLRLVDFDGNPPSKGRRYQRLFGSLLSLLAAGIGLIWSLVDEDRLAWHDHISSTFPTIKSED